MKQKNRRKNPERRRVHGPWDQHKDVKWILSVILAVILFTVVVSLQGCSYISAFGGDSSTLKVERECNVEISQAAHVAGREESNVAEIVRINERCEVEVDFRQGVEEQRMEGSLLENAVGTGLVE